MFVPKQVPKQQWHQVEEERRNWLELPDDLTAIILFRVGVIDIFENAQYVCTSWHKICKEPAMWRVIYMDDVSLDHDAWSRLQEMCKYAVDRSQGQLVDLTLVGLANNELLLYIADRSSQLRRLDIGYCFYEFVDGWTEVLKKFPLLEELRLYCTDILKEDIEGAGRCCPMLRTLKVNQRFFRSSSEDSDEESVRIRNEIAVAIGKKFPELRHLELIGDSMSNTGLQAILDGCRHLESLDLRQCFNIDMDGELGRKCSERVKCLKLPNDDYLKEPPYMCQNDDVPSAVVNSTSTSFDDLYYDYVNSSNFDYDDYMEAYNDSDNDSIDIKMPSKSKSNRQKPKKVKKPLQKQKKQRRVKEQKRKSGFDWKLHERSI